MVKLEGINTKRKPETDPRVAAGKDFKQFSANHLFPYWVSVINQDVDLGKIVEVIEQPHLVLDCSSPGRKALIPIHKTWKNWTRKTVRYISACPKVCSRYYVG